MRYLLAFYALLWSFALPLRAEDSSIEIQVENKTGQTIKSIYGWSNSEEANNPNRNLLLQPIPDQQIVSVLFPLADLDGLRIVFQSGKRFEFTYVELDWIKQEYHKLSFLWDGHKIKIPGYPE